MKKHDEGYVLPLVMVVLVILSAFALSVLSPAVNNLKAQQVSIARMEDRYLAKGNAEEKIGELLTSFPYEMQITASFDPSYGNPDDIVTMIQPSMQATLDEELLHTLISFLENDIGAYNLSLHQPEQSPDSFFIGGSIYTTNSNANPTYMAEISFILECMKEYDEAPILIQIATEGVSDKDTYSYAGSISCIPHYEYDVLPIGGADS